jgi:ribosomal protein S18 acetylase RimI-like enzyme
MDVTISEVKQIDPELVAAFERLMPQLSDSATRLGVRDLEEIVSSPATTLLLARDLGGEIVGTVTLVVFRIPSGRRARIESLIVDRSVRGRRVGFALCQAALEKARQRAADTVDLTSSRSREAANALYARMGFALRASNVYRYSMARDHGDQLPDPQYR